MGTNRDNVWRETGIIDSFPRTGAKVLWRQPVGGGYAGPAVSNGRVYVADFQPDQSAQYPEGQKRNSKGLNGFSVWTKQAVRSFGNMSIRSTIQFPIQLALVARQRSTEIWFTHLVLRETCTAWTPKTVVPSGPAIYRLITRPRQQSGDMRDILW